MDTTPAPAARSIEALAPTLPTSVTRLRDTVRGVSARQLRLFCGLVLFSYLISHFLNHALGNISLEAMALGLDYHILLWQFLPVAVLFYASATVHAGLGLWALYDRRQFRWKAIEPLQLVLGLSIPLLLVNHVVGTRMGQSVYEHQQLYPQALYYYWVWAPLRGWLMYLVILVAWIHGCIGLYFWLRLRAFYQHAAPYLLAAAVLIPTLALLGLYQSGRIVTQLGASPQWRAENLGPKKPGPRVDSATIDRVVDYSTIGYLGLLALVLAARGARMLNERRRGMVRLSYGSDTSIRVPKGLSVLEASLRFNIPHASVCGGRARCSTCRIRVVGDCRTLPAPSNREAFVLNRVGCGDDPAIRLACQLRPVSDLSFVRIFPPQTTTALLRGASSRSGQERYLVSLFVDMRGSTTLAETRLPFDTVFIVNRFHGAVAEAVLDCGGQPNQFIGDGQLALFGLDCDPENACRQALRAAALIAANIEALNAFLANDLREPLRFGIGIHGGEVIVGDIGFRDHMVFTALGDPVNVAARLQDVTKTMGCEVVISDEVRETAGLPADMLPTQQIAIRGRVEAMNVRAIVHARDLADLDERLAG